MIPFEEAFPAILAALIVPTLVGLLIVAAVARYVSGRWLAAFAVGIYFWFFSDTIGDSSYLGVNSGFGGGAEHLALVLLFIFGILLVFSIDREVFKLEVGESTVAKLGFGVALLAAFAVGMHGFGEGADFGVSAATTASTNLITAFGGASAVLAFVLHKGLEPMMAGIIYWIYCKGHAKSVGGVIKDNILIMLAFTIPGIIGGATDYYLNYDDPYFFAFGLGTSLYAILMLAKPLFWKADVTNTDSIKIALVMLFGFFCIYFAALFHS
jgi:hypothetical protein